MSLFILIRRTALAAAVAAPVLLVAQTPTPAATTPLTPVRLSLGDAARLAAQKSLQVEGARTEVAEAQAVVAERRADRLPQFSASALQSGRTFNTVTFGITFPSSPGQPPLFNPNGQVEGPVNTLDVRAHAQADIVNPVTKARIKAAEAGVDAANASMASVADQAADQAAGAYIQLLRVKAELDARGSDSSLAVALVTIAQDQLTAGTGVLLDVTRAQTQVAAVHSQLVTARTAVSRARIALLRAIGLPLDTPVETTDSLNTPSANDVVPGAEAAVSVAMDKRLDVRAIQEQRLAVDQQTDVIKAGRLPAFSAFGDGGVIGGSVIHMLPTYTYGLQLSVPFLDQTRRATQLEAQSAQLSQIDVRLRDLREQIGTDVRDALLDLSGAREQVDAAREQVRLGEAQVSQARDRFAAGVTGNADVVSALLGLTSARTALVDALTQYQNARVELARAEGTVTDLK